MYVQTRCLPGQPWLTLFVSLSLSLSLLLSLNPLSIYRELFLVVICQGTPKPLVSAILHSTTYLPVMES